jgi:hypothetical protein
VTERLHALRLEQVTAADLYTRETGVMLYDAATGMAHWRCPCGCGDLVGIRVGPGGWTLEEGPNGATISPSILHHNCGAHYFIRNGRVEWC